MSAEAWEHQTHGMSFRCEVPSFIIPGVGSGLGTINRNNNQFKNLGSRPLAWCGRCFPETICACDVKTHRNYK